MNQKAKKNQPNQEPDVVELTADVAVLEPETPAADGGTEPAVTLTKEQLEERQKSMKKALRAIASRISDLEELKNDGIVTAEQIEAAWMRNTTSFNTEFTTSHSVEDLKKLVAGEPKGPGKRAESRSERDNLITETQDLSAALNTGIKYFRTEIDLTDDEKIRLFDLIVERANTLSHHMKTAFAPVGAMTMIWNPRCQNAESADGLAVHIGGWGDGSKVDRFQYAPRKCPVSKRSGYRDDSFSVDFAEIPEPDIIPEA